MSADAALRLSTNTGMILVGRLCKMALSFGFVLYVAALLGVRGFGQYTLAVHYFELFLSLTATATGILLTREIARARMKLKDETLDTSAHSRGVATELVWHSMALVLGLSVIAVVLMAVLCRVFGYGPETSNASMVASLALFPASIAVVLEAVFVGLEAAQHVAWGTALESVLRIALSCLALMLGYGLISLFVVLIFTRLLLMIYYAWAVRAHASWRPAFHAGRFRQFASEWRVFAAENWMATIYTSLDVVILSIFHGEAAVGIYSAAWKIVRLGSVAAKSYTTAVFPVLARLHHESRERFQSLSRDTIRFMLAIALPGVVVVSVLTERIVGLLFTDEYAAAVPVLRVLIWVLLLEFLNPFLSHTLFARGLQLRSMQVAGVSLVVNLVATLLLVVQWEAWGAAVGTLLGGGVACVFYCIYALSSDEAFEYATITLRVTLAAICLTGVLYLFRSQTWLWLGMWGAVSYAGLLVALRVVTPHDFRFIHRFWHSRVGA
ncbi:MAG: flippase [Planctomycetales bacterium]|nr:flippase [Planctomycetales bacterium]